jgi:hypothetical protein
MEAEGLAAGQRGKCPTCGGGFQVPAPVAAWVERPQTIELTAKRWKMLQLIGVGVVLGAACLMYLVAIAVGDATLGRVLWATLAVAAVAGVGLYLYAAICAWWHHG